MGGSSSKAVSVAPRSESIGNALKEIVSSTATSAKRKIQKEGRQYMAPERAQRELETQKIIPKRAPMNIGNAKVSESARKTSLKDIEDLQAHDNNYLSRLKDVFVSSSDPAGQHNISAQEHSSRRSSDLEQKLPKIRERGGFESLESSDIPRGRTSLKSVIEALYNHKMSPEDWGPAEISERLRLRESDAKDLLKHFELLDGTSIFPSKLPYDSK